MERSKGKMRPSLPRASDLPNPVPDGKPTGGRGPGGRFAAANPFALEARAINAATKVAGKKTDPGEAGTVARDTRRLTGGYLRALESNAVPVRAMAALAARHAALAAYYSAKAVAAGLDTLQGMKFQDAADRQSQRAERTLVTAEDLAARHAKAERLTSVSTPPWFVETDEEPTP